jgi:glutathione S-transferase
VQGELSSHLFAGVPKFSPSAAAQTEISRIFEIWSHCLTRSGGPFLFGPFGIADAMYFPVLARLRTYGIAPPESLMNYAQTIEGSPAVQKLLDMARSEPRIPVYDDYVRSLGGDPETALAG